MKYEEVNLRAYADVPEAGASIGWFLDFNNSRWPHQAYFNAQQPIPAAA